MLTAPPAPFKELPNYSWSDWDRVTAVKASIRQLEYGILDTAALIVEAMRRDDRIAGCLDRRTQALPALPFNLEPANDSAPAKKACELLQENFENVFPDGVVSELHTWSVMLGPGTGQLIWTTKDDLWWPRLRIFHPRFFMWRWDTRMWHVNTEQEAAVPVTPGDGQWVMLGLKALERAYMWGAIRSLYVPWLLRQWALRDWGRWSEVYGQPIRVARTPNNTDDADKQRFIKELANLGSEAVVRLPQAPGAMNEWDTYGLELLEAKSTGADGFERLITKVETGIAVTLLGQNLTTEVKGGSYSATQVHESIRAEILQADGQLLAKTLRDQVLKPWAAFNFGDPELAPKMCWNTDPPEDKVAAGTALKNLGDGIAALQKTGAKPDVDELLERAAVPTSGPAGDPPAPPPAPMPGAPGQHAPPVQHSLRIKASGAMKGQLYADELTESAKRTGTRLIGADARRLLEVVLHSSNFDDLKERIVAAYGAMEPDALAELMQRAMTMAELAGQVSVLEDIGK